MCTRPQRKIRSSLRFLTLSLSNGAAAQIFSCFVLRQAQDEEAQHEGLTLSLALSGLTNCAWRVLRARSLPARASRSNRSAFRPLGPKGLVQFELPGVWCSRVRNAFWTYHEVWLRASVFSFSEASPLDRSVPVGQRPRGTWPLPLCRRLGFRFPRAA